MMHITASQIRWNDESKATTATAAIKGIQLYMDGAGHSVCFERPGELDRIVGQLLGEVGA